MTQRFKYRLYLIALCLTSALSLQAQYSEQDLLSEANMLFEQHKYAEAMPLYAQLLSLEPTKPEFNYKYGATALYGDASKKEEAIRYLRFASTKNGIDKNCWYFLGKAYHLNYQFADAIAAYQKFQELSSKKELADLNVDREIEDCRNGQNLLSNIKEVTVLAKNKSLAESFFRIYDLSDIGGKILITPDALLSSLDKKRNHRSLILFRGSGTTVYFSSYGKDGSTGLDIYMAEVLPNGAFSTPQKLGPEINTPYDEDYPFLHPDNKTFYFSSKGHNSMGGYDIFHADMDPSTGKFSNPENLDFAINTPDDDLFYVVDSAKQMANFASSRSSKQGELDVYKVLVKSAPAEITLIKGSFKNDISPKNKLAKITVVDASTNAQIDVQYTDPHSGDYVLSFPRSGRFKFLVEVEKSNQIHSGMVDIPRSSGIKAYLQNMELVSVAGTEKLLINNLFDQTFDGDVTALAQKLLRQRAALDVNFNSSEKESEPVSDVKPVQDVAMAYAAAGFGAGLSNRKVLEMSQERTQKIEEESEKIEQLRNAAAKNYAETLTIAEKKKTEAAALIAKAEGKTGDERSKIMFDAGIAKLKAENAIQEAENSKALVGHLALIGDSTKIALERNQQFDDSLEIALEGNNYNIALKALKREKYIQEKTDKSFEKYNPVAGLQSESITAQKDAKKYLDRASSLRSQNDELQARLVTRNRQRETAKGKDADKLDGEIANLKAEIANSERRTDKAFAEASIIQEEAFNKSQQYTILARLSSESQGGKTSGTEVYEINSVDLDQLVLSISNLNIDNQAVSSYLVSNPEAGNVFENDQVAMAFRREYAGQNATGIENNASANDQALLSDATAENSNKPENVNNSGVNNEKITEKAVREIDKSDALKSTEVELAAANGKANSNNRSSQDNSEVTNIQSVENGAISDIESVKSDNKVDDSKSINSESDTFSGVEIAEEGDLSLSENATAVADGSQKINSAKANSDGVTAESNNSDLADNKIEVANQNEAEKTQETPSQKIKAEKVKIDAAEDWIAIIDASIAELEVEIEGDKNPEKEELQAQLEQYQALKKAKENEISKSQSSISKIENDERLNSEAVEAAVASAKMDVDTLTASLVSRLEMKSNESASDIESIKNIRKVDAHYLPELASIELSGLSDPEIAAKRIALNAQFITSVDQKLTNPAIEKAQSENLLELRRMKMLEILKDRKVELGELAYQPLTPEAREYKSMVADNGADSSDQELTNTSIKYPNMSPELAAELQVPYSRNIVLPGYAEEMNQMANLNNDSQKAASRIDINKDYLKNLQADIEIYAAALEGTTNAENKIALQNRYDILLAERSAVIDEIHDDEERLNADISDSTVIQNEEAELAQKVETNSPKNPEKNTAANTDVNSVAVPDGNTSEKTGEKAVSSESSSASANKSDKKQPNTGNPLVKKSDLVLYYDSLYSILSNEIIAESTNKTERLNKMSALNASLADQIDTSINELMNQLDNPEANINRDAVQLEIQELDAIAADKRQEADRLSSEAELVIVQPKAGVTEQIDDSISRIEETAENSATAQINEEEINRNIQEAKTLIQAPELSSRIYKSLNANIKFNAIRAKIDSSAKMRREVQNMINEIEAIPAGADRAKKSAELAQLNSKLKANNAEIDEVIADSNAAEIAFFQSANDAVIMEIQGFSEISRDTLPLQKLSSQRSVLADKFSENETNLQNGLITKSEKIMRDRELIAQLDSLNTQLDDIVEAHQVQNSLTADSGSKPDKTVGEDIKAINSDSSDNRLADSSTNFEQEHGMAYITPVYRSYESNMTPEKKANYIAVTPELQVSPILYESSDPESDYKLLSSVTKIDEKGIKLLKGSPSKMDYITASLKADSLKKIEIRKSEFAENLTQSARETKGEVKRLEIAKGNEQDEKRKNQIQNRIDLLNTSAEQEMEKASLAAFQAEDLRVMRKKEEEIIARSAAKLTSNDLAELNAVMNNKTYTVVPSDLASTEINNKPVQSTPKKNVEIAVNTDTLRNETPASDVVTVNENLSSIDEKLLLEAHGNWLNVVEVIAQKDDFSDVQESLFIDTDQPIYTASTPIPMNPDLPKGLVFQVQVGAFRNKIPQDLFGEFAPIMGEKLDNGITRYRAGVFKQYRNALEAKSKIRARGYSDAFVVAYIDGERLTGAQAQDILRQAQVKEGVTATEIAQLKEAEKPVNKSAETPTPQDLAKIESSQPAHVDYYSDPEAARATQVEVTPGLFYTVQVGVYSKPVKLDKLFNLVELNSELTASNYIRYTSGRYSSVEAAGVRKAEAIEKGVIDAFITAYYNGKRISLPEAQELLARNGNSILSTQMSNTQQIKSNTSVTTPAPKSKSAVKSEPESKPEAVKDNVKYVVILGSYAGDIPQNVANVFLERSDLQIRRVTAPNGVSIYASPEFETLAEAEDFLKLSRKAGIDSAVMGKVVDGKISAVETK